ncbi:MAG: hypothetical protein IJO40_04010 [Thermoguttaceae bacterium]|nr:hypothetical protein [Thermoguttaceae bacterium]
MSESLFQISCPSCESVFAVTDPELIGQIVACPKCGGMMLVETTSFAQNRENALDNANAPINELGEVDEVGEVAQDDEALANVDSSDAPPQDAFDWENAQNKEGGEGNAAGDAENDAAVERSRGGGKLVASGIALALVGALAFAGTRCFNGGTKPTSETNVGAENGENREVASGGAKDDVGGFAPFAVEERTSDGEKETEFLPNDASELEDGENAAFEETEGKETVGDFGEDAQDLSVASDGVGEEASEAKAEETGEIGGIGEIGEIGGNSDGVAIEENAEGASEETDAVVEDAPSLDEGGDNLEGLGDLGGLDEGEAVDVEENEADAALENLDEELSAEEKLAGSDASTGFNEADFERANQNDDAENGDEPAEVDWSGVASTTNPTLQGALPTLRRERKEIDVDARLALPIKSIEFPTSPVAAIRLLSEFTGVSIVPDLETFVLTRPSTSATLDLALRDTTADEALEKVADLLNWEVCKEKDRILIRPSDYDPEIFVEERFDVADLTTARAQGNDETRLETFELPNNLTTEALVALIKSTVAPETWSENGGNANLTVDGTTLVIGQNAQNREKTRILLEGLRAIRGLEARGDAAPERIIPEKLGWEKLTKKTTFAPLSPVALQNAVEILEKSQKLQVFWDDAALIEAGVGRDSTTAARLENGTLDAVLCEILEPLNAAYLILDENLIFITDNNVAKNYQTVEFFSLIGENGERPTLAEARALVDEIKLTVAPESWRKKDAALRGNASNGEIAESAKETENGEREPNASATNIDENPSSGVLDENKDDAAFDEATPDRGKGALWLDVESSCLIIRQSQPNQRALRRWLSVRLADLTKEKEEAE